MKRTIRTLGWRFNTDRMVIDYASSATCPPRAPRAADAEVSRRIERKTSCL